MTLCHDQIDLPIIMTALRTKCDSLPDIVRQPGTRKNRNFIRALGGLPFCFPGSCPCWKATLVGRSSIRRFCLLS